MVEVNVGDDDPAQVGRPEPEGRQGCVHRGDTRLRTGLDQGRHGSIDQESGGQLVHAPEQRVELVYPGCDLDGVAHSRNDLGYGVGLAAACWASSACSCCRSFCTLASSTPYCVKLPAMSAASA